MPVLLPGTCELSKLLARETARGKKRCCDSFLVFVDCFALRKQVKWRCANAHLIKVGSHIFAVDVLVHYLHTSKSKVSAQEIRHYLF